MKKLMTVGSVLALAMTVAAETKTFNGSTSLDLADAGAASAETTATAARIIKISLSLVFFKAPESACEKVCAGYFREITGSPRHAFLSSRPVTKTVETSAIMNSASERPAAVYEYQEGILSVLAHPEKRTTSTMQRTAETAISGMSLRTVFLSSLLFVSVTVMPPLK